MEREKDFRSYLVTRNADEKTQNFSVELVDDFLSVMEEQGMDFPENDLADIKYYAHNKIAGKPDAYERIIGLARYCRFSNHDAGLFYLVTMCGTIGVLDSMQARMRLVLGDKEADKIISTMKNPPLGSVYEAYPEVVNSMLSVMQRSLPIKTCRKILAGNHHGIPVEKFNYDKEKFKELGSIDDYLKFRTSSMLEEMELCMNEGRMWYEQKITPRVLEFVRANPEIQAGVREGNTVYITKIPYDPEKFLDAVEPKEKRFHACHCPFVRSSIADGSVQVSPMWCYCTGGFEKLPFDVIFEKELDVEVLETVLGGDDRCRFAVTLPDEVLPE